MIKTYLVFLSIVGMLAAPSVMPAQSASRNPIPVAQAALDALVKRHSTRHIVLEQHTGKRTELDRELRLGSAVSTDTSEKWTVSFTSVDFRSDSVAFVTVRIRSASTPACLDEVPIVMSRRSNEWKLQLWLNSRRHCNGPS